jgi:cell division protein FtsW
MMQQKLQVDKWLFSATVGLALFGVVMVYSASAIIAVQENHSQFHYVVKQGIWTLIGFGAMFVAMRFNYQQLNRRWIVYGLLLLTIFLLVGVFAFPPVNGARRWIKFSGFSAQPSELAKLSLAIFVAYVIERRAGVEGSFWRTFVPCMLALAIFAGLVAKETDLNGSDAGNHRVHDLFCRGCAAKTSCACDRAGAVVCRQDADLHAVSHEAPCRVH